MDAKTFALQTKSPYAWPGGYPLYAITSDGGVLCMSCCKSEARQIIPSIKSQLSDGWQVQAFDVNWEDPHLICDHCGNPIESAYADDDTTIR